MIWEGASLVDASGTHAEATPDTLTFGDASLRLTSPAHAVAPGGAEFRLRRVGMTVLRYRADCDGRQYALNRVGGKRREILDAHGRVVARTRGRADGSLEVDPVAELDLDVVFMTWALTFVDTPTRRTMR